jgi:octaprenyl-diphosphate synthase
MRDELLIPVEGQMAEVEKIFEAHLKSDVPLVTQAARYVTQNGGKRIRPAIFLLSAALAGQRHERLPYLAAAIELVHTASLLHDDVVDNANLRRGKPSAKVKWGNHISILVGDFLWCKASEFFINYGSDRLSRVVTKAITSITEGEILEITKLNDLTIDEGTYQKIIEGKTAALFGICGQGAAIIQNLSERFETALQEFAFNLGVAFQLTDDVLDYISDDDNLGKESGADLREGKLTLPLIISLKRCGPDETRIIRESFLTGQISKDQFKNIVDIVHRREGIPETAMLARQYADKAKACLDVFKPSIERDALMGLADYTIERRA